METSETKPKKSRGKKSASASAPLYTEITRGDKYYSGAELTKKLFTEYPEIAAYIRDNKIDHAREYGVSISHEIINETGKKSRAGGLIKTAGNGKNLKSFPDFPSGSFTLTAAQKTFGKHFPTILKLNKLVFYITVYFGTKSPRFHISHTN